ncbi:MAG: DNA polymerase I [Eubacteriales bacterium]|nr:DNA polymerase I [Eubacteriales bacterium]
MKKILVIDGYSIINRAFYGVPRLTAPDGTPTNAVHGFFNILLKVMDDYQPDFVLAAFDVKGPNFRHEISTDYKANRKKMPDELLAQVPIVEEMLGHLQVPVLTASGFEADDIIGTVSRRETENGHEVYILSGDRDLLALVDERCFQILPKTAGGETQSIFYTTEQVKKDMGVRPERIRDLKAIMGDSSDNIQGVRGVGEKGALKLLSTYDSLDDIYAHVDEISATRTRNAMLAGKEDAYISYDLAQIRRDVPDIRYTLDAFMADGPQASLEAACLRYGLNSLRRRFLGEEETALKEIEIKETDLAGLQDAADRQDMPYDVAVTVTPDKDAAAIAFPGEDVVYLVREHLDEALQYINDGALRLITFDVKAYHHHLPFARDGRDFFDAKLAAYCLDATDKLTYEALYFKYAGEALSFPAKPEAAEAAALAARVAMDIMAVLEERIIEEDVYQLFYEIEMPLAFVLLDMSKTGIAADAERLAAYGEELLTHIAALEETIYAAAGRTFNIGSPKQLGTVLFDELKLTGGKKRKSGWSTAADILDKVRDQHPIVEQVLMWRRLSKLKSTYVDGLTDCIADDGRIHGRFHQTVTATGRLSSTEPNLQNIPIRTEEGREIRKVLVAKPGYVFVDADYSQIELRILAILSEDPVMIADFRDGADIHRSTAARIFGIPQEEVTADQRRSAKAINFGIIYGMGGFSLGENLSITKKEADAYIKHYFEHYKAVKKYLDGQILRAKDDGYVETMFHRRRYIPEIHAKNFMQRAFGERIAMNSPIQGTAADIIKIAMNNVHHRLKHDKVDAKLILQIHDELLIEAREDMVEQVKEILSREMRQILDASVPLLVDVNTGKDLYSLK